MNFLIRSFNSLIYVVLLLGSLYIDAVFFSIVLLLIAILAQVELHKINNNNIIFIYMFFPAAYQFTQFTHAYLHYIVSIGVFGSLSMLGLFRNSNKLSYSVKFVYFFSLFHICIPLILLALLGQSNPMYVLYFFGVKFYCYNS